MNHNVNKFLCFPMVLGDPSPKGHDPEVENHSSRITLYLVLCEFYEGYLLGPRNNQNVIFGTEGLAQCACS